MPDSTFRLIYPPELFDVPVIHQLIRHFDLTVNITGAEIYPDRGWLEIRVTGEAMEIERALGWLNSQGIEIQKSSV